MCSCGESQSRNLRQEVSVCLKIYNSNNNLCDNQHNVNVNPLYIYINIWVSDNVTHNGCNSVKYERLRQSYNHVAKQSILTADESVYMS